jgi:hypothetical protein
VERILYEMNRSHGRREIEKENSLRELAVGARRRTLGDVGRQSLSPGDTDWPVGFIMGGDWPAVGLIMGGTTDLLHGGRNLPAAGGDGIVGGILGGGRAGEPRLPPGCFHWTSSDEAGGTASSDGASAALTACRSDACCSGSAATTAASATTRSSFFDGIADAWSWMS